MPAAGGVEGEPATGALSPTYPKNAPPGGTASISLGDTVILRDLLRGIKGDDGEFLAQVVGGEPRSGVAM